MFGVNVLHIYSGIQPAIGWVDEVKGEAGVFGGEILSESPLRV
jgi:hypothetical protein